MPIITGLDGTILKLMNMPSDKLYSISEVVDLTGATEFLLRTWELRYKVVQPKRTKTGRRLYSTDDVMKISKIVQLSQQGHKISHLAARSWSDLSQLEIQPAPGGTPALASAKNSSPVQKVFEALSTTDWVSLQNLFAAQSRKMQASQFIFNFIIPIAQEMSRRSLENSLDIIQEHLLTSLIKENLYRLQGPSVRPKKKFKIIFATPEGDYHDLGLLLSKAIAQLKGHHCVFLGSHVPKKELSEACVRLNPTHVVIGVSLNSNQALRDHILKYLNFVDRYIPKAVELWVGGSGSQDLALKMNRAFSIFRSLDEYASRLQVDKEIAAHL